MPRKPRNKSQRLDNRYEKKAGGIARGADVQTADKMGSQPNVE